ncbi:MAG: major facilitator super transporter protein [Caeruleum heppii]|nr:MAG: major facilitator super transporter protein [Caeruleum heppii]
MLSFFKPSFMKLLLVLANVLIPVAISFFARGFFPYKPFLPGLAQHHGQVSPEAPFNRVVFMVVDALRSDFVYAHNSGFQYTQHLISSGAAMPFTAHATSPTITMPRVKAMTTGSIPSFLDVILNFAESDTTSTLASQDTWLAQMKAKGNGELIMYGDDTWLKLFPGTFSRADGTSSFFVSDFTEVDQNVTRHITSELNNDDWNTMVLHYLGLDHIGHKSGPRSVNMIPKQEEMDAIVREIYEAIEQQPQLQSTLLVLCGDHGMNDAGNHGGSAPGETSPALVFLSPKLKEISKSTKCPIEAVDEFQYYDAVEQSDLVPTLAGLLDFPVPLNNLGVFIPSFLGFWPEKRDQVQLLRNNAEQILRIVKATFQSFKDDEVSQACRSSSSDIEDLECQWTQARRLLRQPLDSASAGDTLETLTKFAKQAQNVMSSTASNYDLSKLATGITISAVATVLAVIVSFPAWYRSQVDGTIFVVVAASFGGMMFASSYVEEEQHFWYWATTGWLAYLALQQNRKFLSSQTWSHAFISPSMLFGLRLLRRWNQTGQKYAGAPDIAHSFLPKHTVFMWLAVLVTYYDVLQRLARRGFPYASTEVSTVLAMALCLSALCFKCAFTYADAPELLRALPPQLTRRLGRLPLVLLARVVFVGIAVTLVAAIAFRWWRRQTAKSQNGYGTSSSTSNRNPSSRLRGEPATIYLLHDLLTLFLLTQSRSTNIPLFFILETLLNLLLDLSLSPTQITTTSLLFQHATFFALGGSNAISSIDLSNAYNGVSGYNVIAVGILTFVSNWAGAIWWTSATVILFVEGAGRSNHEVQNAKDSKKKAGITFDHLALLTLFETISLVFVMAACTMLRTHLFIWTVFSPKFLYSMAWSLAQHLGINVLIGGGLLWISQER